MVLSPGAQLSIASVNKLATCWALSSLGSLSAVVGTELAGALGPVRVAAGVLDRALPAGTRTTVVVVVFTLGPAEDGTGANVVGGNMVGGGRSTAVLGAGCPR